MTLLVKPLPVTSSALSTTRCAPGATPRRASSPDRSCRGPAAAGDDARDVRAVSVVVVGERLGVDEVGEVHDPAVEVLVPGVDARIDRRNADAGAGDAEMLATHRAPVAVVVRSMVPRTGDRG